MNEAVQFTFYPVGGFTNPGINKSVGCPKKSNSDFDLPDADCEGDKYEACLQNVSSCDDDTCTASKQFDLSQFLYCFEGEHGSAMSAADSCASAAGFDVGQIRGCYDDPAYKAAVWKSLQDRTSAVRPTLTCFPWVEVDGQVLTKNCFGSTPGTWPLLQALCDRAEGAGVQPPAACGDFEMPVVV